MTFDQATVTAIDLTSERLAFMETLAAYIGKRIEGIKGDALELGAGKGALSIALKDRFAHIDLLDTLYAENTFPEIKLPEHLVRINDDFYSHELEKTYDCIYNSLFLHHLKDEAKGLAKMSRLMNPGGKLFICDLYTEDGRFHPDDMKGIYHYGFDPDRLANILKAEGCAINNIETIFTLEKDGREYPLFMLECTKA